MKHKLSFVQVELYFASDFRSFAGAPISLNVLLHVLEVVLQLFDPVWSSCGSDRQLVPVVPVNSISQVSCVRSFLLLFFSVPQAPLLFNICVLVPDLQGTARHHNQTLNIVFQIWPSAT